MTRLFVVLSASIFISSTHVHSLPKTSTGEFSEKAERGILFNALSTERESRSNTTLMFKNFQPKRSYAQVSFLSPESSKNKATTHVTLCFRNEDHDLADDRLLESLNINPASQNNRLLIYQSEERDEVFIDLPYGDKGFSLSYPAFLHYDPACSADKNKGLQWHANITGLEAVTKVEDGKEKSRRERSDQKKEPGILLILFDAWLKLLTLLSLQETPSSTTHNEYAISGGSGPSGHDKPKKPGGGTPPTPSFDVNFVSGSMGMQSLSSLDFPEPTPSLDWQSINHPTEVWVEVTVNQGAAQYGFMVPYSQWQRLIHLGIAGKSWRLLAMARLMEASHKTEQSLNEILNSLLDKPADPAVTQKAFEWLHYHDTLIPSSRILDLTEFAELLRQAGIGWSRLDGFQTNSGSPSRNASAGSGDNENSDTSDDSDQQSDEEGEGSREPDDPRQSEGEDQTNQAVMTEEQILAQPFWLHFNEEQPQENPSSVVRVGNLSLLLTSENGGSEGLMPFLKALLHINDESALRFLVEGWLHEESVSRKTGYAQVVAALTDERRRVTKKIFLALAKGFHLKLSGSYLTKEYFGSEETAQRLYQSVAVIRPESPQAQDNPPPYPEPDINPPAYSEAMARSSAVTLTEADTVQALNRYSLGQNVTSDFLRIFLVNLQVSLIHEHTTTASSVTQQWLDRLAAKALLNDYEKMTVDAKTTSLKKIDYILSTAKGKSTPDALRILAELYRLLNISGKAEVVFSETYQKANSVALMQGTPLTTTQPSAGMPLDRDHGFSLQEYGLSATTSQAFMDLFLVTLQTLFKGQHISTASLIHERWILQLAADGVLDPHEESSVKELRTTAFQRVIDTINLLRAHTSASAVEALTVLHRLLGTANAIFSAATQLAQSTAAKNNIALQADQEHRALEYQAGEPLREEQVELVISRLQSFMGNPNRVSAQFNTLLQLHSAAFNVLLMDFSKVSDEQWKEACGKAEMDLLGYMERYDSNQVIKNLNNFHTLFVLQQEGHVSGFIERFLKILPSHSGFRHFLTR